MPYATVTAIRESAGLLRHVENETPAGDVDGANKLFTAKRRPFVDYDGDDNVTDMDVRAYVDDTAVDVASVDAQSGQIRLSSAPAVGKRVTIDYYFSPIETEYVQGKETEAEDWVNTKIKKVMTTPLRGSVPGIISTATELYAAGLILLRDYGSRSDTELTSKDGSEKIKHARQLLEDYVQGVVDEAKAKIANGNAASATSVGDRDVFSRVAPPLESRDLTNDDRFFFNRE